MSAGPAPPTIARSGDVGRALGRRRGAPPRTDPIPGTGALSGAGIASSHLRRQPGAAQPWAGAAAHHRERTRSRHLGPLGCRDRVVSPAPRAGAPRRLGPEAGGTTASGPDP